MWKRLRFAVGITAIVVGGATVSAPGALAQSDPAKGFALQADAICKGSNERLATAAKGYERHVLLRRRAARSQKQKVAKPADVSEFITKVAAVEIRKNLDQLAALKAPDKQGPLFDAALKEANSAYAVMIAKPNEVAYLNPFLKAGKQFAALGIAACGQTVSGSDSA